ncbi:MAG: CCA tRNA nucleotidyltransferase [Planctomycetota bacterium]
MSSGAREAALRIARTLRGAGHEALLAGGCVRDHLRGVEPEDYDVATAATVDQVRGLFRRTIPVGEAFGVAVVVEGDHRCEVATFRKDVGVLDGRHPAAVRAADPRTDARRRDFTINGMFLDPDSGEVLDFVEGREDLRRRAVRCIGDPARRFEEDRLRMLRAVRFATVLDFTLDPGAAAAARAAAPGVAGVSAERVREELNRILLSGRGGRGLGLLLELGLLPVILPEIAAMVGVDQPPRFHPEGDLFTHTRLVLDGYRTGGIEVALGALLHDVGKPTTRTVDERGRTRFPGHSDAGADLSDEILARLRYPTRTVKRVHDLVARHMDWPNLPRMREAKRRRWLLRDDFDLHLELHRLDCQASHGDLSIHEYARRERRNLDEEPPPVRPLVCGTTLIEMGYRPGPAFGKILEAVVDAQLEGGITSEEEARRWVAERFRPPHGEPGGDGA